MGLVGVVEEAKALLELALGGGDGERGEGGDAGEGEEDGELLDRAEEARGVEVGQVAAGEDGAAHVRAWVRGRRHNDLLLLAGVVLRHPWTLR